MSTNEKINYFAETDFRNRKIRFGIKEKDRAKHVYVIGKTGMGKSTLLENMAVQDIQNGEGLVFMDPHGGSAVKLLEYVPPERIKDVVYFAPFDTDNPVSFNVMEDVGADKHHLVASGLMSTFKKIWVDAWSARMEYILGNILLALLEYPGSTLLGVNRMLADKDYRKIIVENIKDPSVKSFWTNEFAKYGDRYMQEAGAAIQNKIGQFTANPLIRNIIGQAKSSFDVRKLMDEKKILIVNLSKGQIGEQNASLLGGMIITKIYLGAMSRADVSPQVLKELPNFYLYVDEFQSFANDSFADILSEARKYKLNLIIAHQYIEQMGEKVRAAVFGNVGTTITFRVGPFDAEVLEKIFLPSFTKEDIVNLGFAQIYLTLMVDGVGSKPFSAVTLPPISLPAVSYKDEIIKYSRENNAKHKEGIEKEIMEWHEPVVVAKKRDFEPRENMGGDFRTNIKSFPPKPTSFPPRDFSKPLSSPVSQAPRNNNFNSSQNLNQNKTERPNTPMRPVSLKQMPYVGKIKDFSLEKKEMINKPQSSSKLKDILATLESEEKALEGKEVGEKNNAESVSLNTLYRPPVRGVDTKKVSVENSSKLKEALLKAMSGNPPKTEKKEIKEEVKLEKKEEIKKVKEVPEDVLKKILE